MVAQRARVKSAGRGVAPNSWASCSHGTCYRKHNQGSQIQGDAPVPPLLYYLLDWS